MAAAADEVTARISIEEREALLEPEHASPSMGSNSIKPEGREGDSPANIIIWVCCSLPLFFSVSICFAAQASFTVSICASCRV